MPEPTRRRPIADADLEDALRDLGASLAVPAATVSPTFGGDPARLARIRIEELRRARRGWLRRVWPSSGQGIRLGRGAAIALAALLVLAAVAGAIGLGLPGIRIVQGPGASATPSAPGPSAPGPDGSPVYGTRLPTSRPTTGTSGPSVAAGLGDGLALGDPLAVVDLADAVDFPVRLPVGPGIGSPAGAWLQDRRLSLVWPASATLPTTREPGIGLILAEFRGSVEPSYFEKILGPDTTIEPVTVGGEAGFWISGAPHEIVFVDDQGQVVFDSRRIVGDTLLWTHGDLTYRLESGLDRAAAIALAGTLR